MNISFFCCSGNVYRNCECIKGFAFKNTAVWVKCALLPVICAGFGILKGNCAHLGRIGYLLPNIIPA